MEKYIYQVKKSIPDRLCSDIITMYELENTRYPGLTMGGVQRDIKKTTDMIIPKNDPMWYKIETFLYNELSNALKKYLIHIDDDNFNIDDRPSKFTYFNSENLHIDWFMVQKYDMQDGKYIYHNDSLNESKRHRVITYLWYLNDVTDGGETEFWGGKYHIKPETGKLLLFPACWTFPHRGIMPISNDKYIITGWFYLLNK